MTDQPATEPQQGTTFLDGPAPRTQTIPLQWPLVVDGREIREVTVRRINGNEARAYHAAVLATVTQGAPAAVFPGLNLTQREWEALDDDDVTKIDEVVEAFLPARFRPLVALLERIAGLEDGEPTGTGESSPA